MTSTVSRPLRKLLAAGPAIFRDGNALITNDACPAELMPELEALCLPRISDEDGRAVVALLKKHAGRVRYVVDAAEAINVVAELMERKRSPSTSKPPRSQTTARQFRSPSPKRGRCASGSRP
jgi:hypothetical protein